MIKLKFKKEFALGGREIIQEESHTFIRTKNNRYSYI
jgi:hypothetical protein